MNAAKLHFGRAAHQAQYTLERAAAGVIDPSLVVGTGDRREKLKEFFGLMESYTPGGLREGAGRTAGEWQKTWDWLSTYAPVTIISLSPAQPDSSDGAYHQPVTVTLSATDTFHGWIDTRPFVTRYSLDDGSTWLSYTGPFVVSPDGVLRISVYSVDSLGNCENVQNVTLPING